MRLGDGGNGCVVLDAASTILLFSASLERLLGWTRMHAEGQRWVDFFVPKEQQQVVRALVQRSFSGELSYLETEAIGKDGRLYLLSFDVTRVGTRLECLLLSLISARVLTRSGGTEDDHDLEYDIAVGSEEFGTLFAVRSLNAAVARAPLGISRCYEKLYRRSQPCSDCPVTTSEKLSWPRTVVRPHAANPRTYEVLTANKLDGGRVRVRVRCIPDEIVSAVFEAKVGRVATRAELSSREESVLRYLLAGRTLGDIARILGIGIRTVKFHQANVFDKLGVDSRADLLRVLL